MLICFTLEYAVDVLCCFLYSVLCYSAGLIVLFRCTFRFRLCKV